MDTGRLPYTFGEARTPTNMLVFKVYMAFLVGFLFLFGKYAFDGNLGQSRAWEVYHPTLSVWHDALQADVGRVAIYSDPGLGLTLRAKKPVSEGGWIVRLPRAALLDLEAAAGPGPALAIARVVREEEAAARARGLDPADLAAASALFAAKIAAAVGAQTEAVVHYLATLPLPHDPSPLPWANVSRLGIEPSADPYAFLPRMSDRIQAVLRALTDLAPRILEAVRGGGLEGEAEGVTADQAAEIFVRSYADAVTKRGIFRAQGQPPLVGNWRSDWLFAPLLDLVTHDEKNPAAEIIYSPDGLDASEDPPEINPPASTNQGQSGGPAPTLILGLRALRHISPGDTITVRYGDLGRLDRRPEPHRPAPPSPSREVVCAWQWYLDWGFVVEDKDERRDCYELPLDLTELQRAAAAAGVGGEEASSRAARVVSLPPSLALDRHGLLPQDTITALQAALNLSRPDILRTLLWFLRAKTKALEADPLWRWGEGQEAKDVDLLRLGAMRALAATGHTLSAAITGVPSEASLLFSRGGNVDSEDRALGGREEGADPQPGTQRGSGGPEL